MTKAHDAWMASDEWMSEFLADLAASPSRMRMVRNERRRLVPPSHRAAAGYQQETEQLLRFIQGQPNGRNAA